MADQAWAIVINEQNFPAILSEAGGEFDKLFLDRWYATNGEGYFVRDPSSSLDCSLFPDEQFCQLYAFSSGDVDSLFRLIVKQ